MKAEHDLSTSQSSPARTRISTSLIQTGSRHVTADGRHMNQVWPPRKHVQTLFDHEQITDAIYTLNGSAAQIRWLLQSVISAYKASYPVQPVTVVASRSRRLHLEVWWSDGTDES